MEHLLPVQEVSMRKAEVWTLFSYESSGMPVWTYEPITRYSRHIPLMGSVYASWNFTGPQVGMRWVTLRDVSQWRVNNICYWRRSLKVLSLVIREVISLEYHQHSSTFSSALNIRNHQYSSTSALNIHLQKMLLRHSLSSWSWHEFNIR